MATIRDVAQEAGVSIATVSRVLQGSPRVLPETKQRIEAAILRLDYHPNRLAQQLRSQETQNILVIVPELGNTFYTGILDGIERVATLNHYRILIADTHNDAEIERRCFEMLPQKQVDGIITFSCCLPPEEIQRFSEQYPVVIAVRYFDGMPLPNVAIDNQKATKDITGYLLSLGHKRLCFLGGDPSVLVYRDRRNGFLSALAERKIQVDPDLMVTCPSNIQGGYDAITTLLNAHADFTAVVAAGDTMAIGAIRAIRNYHLRVPENIAVVGFDDLELSGLFSPPLTTVRQPRQQIGTRSIEKLLDLIAGKKLPVEQELLKYELIIRESSGGYIGS